MTKLLEKSLIGAEFARQAFVAAPPAGTKFDELLEPDYWGHVARKFNPFDIIEVVPEDGAFYAKLIVVNCGKVWAKVQKLEYVDIGFKAPSGKVEGFAAAIAQTAAEYEVKFAGAAAKWRVVRISDNEVVSKEPLPTRDDAIEFMNSYIKQVA